MFFRTDEHAAECSVIAGKFSAKVDRLVSKVYLAMQFVKNRQDLVCLYDNWINVLYDNGIILNV